MVAEVIIRARKHSVIIGGWFMLAFASLIRSEWVIWMEGADPNLRWTWLAIFVFFTFQVSQDFSITDEGIVWGNWILRFFGINGGRWMIRPWEKVILSKALYWGISFAPSPFGHISEWTYTNSWCFLEEASRRAAYTDPAVLGMIKKKRDHSLKAKGPRS